MFNISTCEWKAYDQVQGTPYVHMENQWQSFKYNSDERFLSALTKPNCLLLPSTCHRHSIQFVSGVWLQVIIIIISIIIIIFTFD